MATALMMLYFAPTTSWWTLGLLALSALNLETLEPRMKRSRRPEYHAGFSVLWTQAVAGGAVALSGGPRSPVLALVIVPTAFAATRFRPQVVTAATASAIGILLLATFALQPSASLADPGGVICAIGVTIAIAAAFQAMIGSELRLRDAAVVDPLTGLLNRTGLELRFAELSHQARLSGESISVLVCDLDRFKAVNDTYGHATGDAVLRDIAYELRKHLRSFDLAYRLGGEEFLVVLPGAAIGPAGVLAERLCEATRRCRPRGIALTLSVGVSSRAGIEASYDDLFDAADRALYRAKESGRDRVCCAPLIAPAQLAAA